MPTDGAVAAPPFTVLVIDDDPTLARVLTLSLEASGYRVAVAPNGLAGIHAAEREPPDLVLLDLGLGDLDGVDVCRRLRARWAYPIVVLSGESAEHRKVEALDAGANDYVTKPFSAPELLARLRAAMRSAGAPIVPNRDVLKVGDVLVDLVAHAAVVGGRSVDLTQSEFTLLVAFVRGVGALLTHDALIRLIWPGGGGSTGALRVHITNLRRKLGEGTDRPSIRTAPKLGYRLVPPGGSDPPWPV